jgi:phosphate-selective porin OprO and OprP
MKLIGLNKPLALALAIGLGTTLAAAPAFAQDPPVAPPAEAPPAPPPEGTPPEGGMVAPVAEAPVAPPEAPYRKEEKPSVGVKYDKGLVFQSDDGEFEMKLALRTQIRFETTRPGEDPGELATHVLIPRGRLQLEGHVFGKDTRYKLELNAADKSQFAFTKDLWVEQAMSSGKVVVRFGQWKQPFNRMEMVSDFGSEFNERANTAEFVEGGRDTGIAIHNDYEKSPEGLEWVFGVFNNFKAATDKPALATKCTDPTMADTCTTAVGTAAQSDWGPTLVLRVGWNLGKVKGYSEGDLDGGPLRLAVAANYKVDLGLSFEKQDPMGDNHMQHAAGVDLLLKVEGFDAFLGGYMVKKGDGDAEMGATVQAGYFVTPKKMQIAARFSMIPNAGDTERKDLEIRGAFNYYWHGHQWKWATDFGVLQTTGDDGATPAVSDKADFQLRSMAQLTF